MIVAYKGDNKIKMSKSTYDLMYKKLGYKILSDKTEEVKKTQEVKKPDFKSDDISVKNTKKAK